MRRWALIVGLAFAGTVHAADSWTYASSEHFEVYATAGDTRARDALNYFERVHAFFTGFLNLSPRLSKPTRLIVFSGERQFAPYRMNEASIAFYQPGPDRDYIVLQNLDADAYPIVVHEYAHLILRHSAGRLYPVWLNEGLAEFFSTVTPDGSRMSVGKVPLDRLVYLNNGAVLLPLDRLFAVTHDSPEYTTKAHAGVFYSESWALTHMLMTDDRYSKKSEEFLRLMADGRPAGDALMTLFGKTPQALQLELMNYVRQSQYLYFLANYKEPPPAARRPTRKPDAFEGELMTANLLANMGPRESEARAAFDRLAVQKPNDLTLLESRAYFELRRGHRPEALPYFARAVEAGSTNAALYRDYAVLEPSRRAALTERAFSLSPDDLDIRLLYASTLLNLRRGAEAVALLNAVKTVPPDAAFEAFQLLANAYLQVNQSGLAQIAAAQAVKYAEPGAEALAAARLATLIDDVVGRQAGSDANRASPPTAAGAAGDRGQSVPAARGVPQGSPAPRGIILLTGRIKNMVCEAAAAPILEFEVEGRVIRLVIDNPTGIAVQNAQGFATIDLTCGAQDVAVRIGFVAREDPSRQTVGLVRSLDYRQTP